MRNLHQVSLSMRTLFSIATVLCLLASEAVAAVPAAAPEFNKDVAPLFKKYCVACHNATDKEGKLVLEDYPQALAGGEHGKAIVSGKADESRLVLALTGKAEPAMPPEGNDQPTAAEIAVIAAWINAGAKPPVGAAPDPTVLVTPQIKPRAEVREAIAAIAFAPDGKSLAIGRSTTVELVSLPERSLVRVLAPHRGRVSAVGFSKDGSQLLSAAGEPGVFGEARLWSLADGRLVRMFQGHQDSVYAAVLSPDGRSIATASYDQQIMLWDAADGKQVRTFAGHNDAVFDLAFRPDGKILASASGDRTVKLWDVASGSRLDTLGQPLKEVYCVVFSPDGKRLAAGGVDNRIRVWQISAEAKENTNPIVYSQFAHEGAVAKVVYSADGKLIASAGEDRTVKLWDAETLKEQRELEKQSDWIAALAISPDSGSLAIGRLDGSLGLYEAKSGSLVPPPAPPKPLLAAPSLRGVTLGATTRLALRGKHLAEVTAVKASDERIVPRLLTVASGLELAIEVAPSTDLVRGRYELWVVAPSGDSNRIALEIDDLPQLAESEPNDTPAQANAVVLPSGMWGVLSKKGDVDHFAFEARAGEKLVFDVAANSIGSKANVVLTLYDAGGRLLADNNDFGGSSDPLLPLTIPADGRYVVAVSDLTLAGGEDHFYRLSLGELSIATNVFPLSVPAGQESQVRLAGFNLPSELRVPVPAAKSGTVTVPLDLKKYRKRGKIEVEVGTLAESVEVEPNDAPQTATPLAAPATMGGRVQSPGDNDYFRFQSKAGQTWIVETDAARRGSPVDTVIEVLDSDGKPVERVLLQAVRDSNVTFRGIDGNTLDCRLTNWEEMQLNQWVYLNGEVLKLFRSPRGPDSGFLFYEGSGGKRMCYFDTSATVHAVEEPCFIVEPHPPGAKLASTGLPIFPLHYFNDDDGERKLGSDSRLTFTAPTDGAYVIRLRDARGAGGDRFAYRLTVRPPRPDFEVKLHGGEATVAAGSGKRFSLSVDRADSFDGEVRVDISGLPEGFRVSTPLVIQAGHREAEGVIFAAADAAQPTPESLGKVAVRATATVDAREVTKNVKGFSQLKLAAKPKLLVRMEPAELVIAPGTTVTAKLIVERNGHDDLITFSVDNLPHGVIVDNIGLNGVLMPKGENERQIFITADSWVDETTRPCFAIENQAGNQCSPPVTVHVRRASPLAGAK
jgi:WD40 repeat protein/mono/diheme cytochrome c family protein